MSNSVRLHRLQPTRLPHPWDSPGKNTGVGCHFLLQCMKVKIQSEVAQSCLTLSDPMDCSPPGSSIHGVFQARVLEWGAIAFSIPCGMAKNIFFYFFSWTYKKQQNWPKICIYYIVGKAANSLPIIFLQILFIYFFFTPKHSFINFFRLLSNYTKFL